MPATAGKRWVLLRSRGCAGERAYPDYPALPRRTTNLLLRTWAAEAQSHHPDAGRTDRSGLSRHGATPPPALFALSGYRGCSRRNNNESGISRRGEELRRSNVIVRFDGRRRSKTAALGGTVETVEV